MLTFRFESTLSASVGLGDVVCDPDWMLITTLDPNLYGEPPIAHGLLFEASPPPASACVDITEPEKYVGPGKLPGLEVPPPANTIEPIASFSPIPEVALVHRLKPTTGPGPPPPPPPGWDALAICKS